MNKANYFIYDIESYPNVFSLTGCFAHKPDKMYQFVCSPWRNDWIKLTQLFSVLRKHDVMMVGYNNVGYDYPVLHELLRADIQPDAVAGVAYQKTEQVIDTDWDDRFQNHVRKPILKQLDLFMIHHFDNKAKLTSLKMLEFNFKMDNVEDLPFEVGTNLDEHDIPVLLDYNAHDVRATTRLFNDSIDMVDLRVSLSAEKKINMTNFNDTKIGAKMVELELEKFLGRGCCYINHKPKQTKRERIIINDVLFPYISFESKEFQAIHRYFKELILDEANLDPKDPEDSITKGVFSDLTEKDIPDYLMPYIGRDYTDTQIAKLDVQKRIGQYYQSRIRVDAKTNKELCIIRDQIFETIPPRMGAFINREIESYLSSSSESFEEVKGKIDGLNVVFNGLQYDLGTGGLHASVNDRVFHSKDDMIIIDVDYEGYYPDVAIQNNMSPAQYEPKAWVAAQVSLKTERRKHTKGTMLNGAYKLGMNATYGKSNDQYSPFFDPQYTMQTCINGQLILCVLAERLSVVEGLEVIQVNTDGLTVHVHKKHANKVIEICKQWDFETGLHLEGAVYKSMWIADVNNYVSEYFDGKTKAKGRYAAKRQLHQNHSALIIPRAVGDYYKHGTSIEETVNKCNKVWDFVISGQAKGKAKILNNGVPIGKVVRYYAVKGKGTALVKRMPTTDKQRVKAPRVLVKDTRLNAETNVNVCNDINDFDWDKLDRSYYIKKAREIVIR